MGVSKNMGTPKWMVFIWKTLLKWMIWGYNYFGNIHILGGIAKVIYITDALIRLQENHFLFLVAGPKIAWKFPKKTWVQRQRPQAGPIHLGKTNAPRKTNECHRKRGHFKRKGSSSNYYFSGDMLVFRGEPGAGWKIHHDHNCKICRCIPYWKSEGFSAICWMVILY